MSLVRNFIGNVNGTLLQRDDRRSADEWYHASNDWLFPQAYLERQPEDDPGWDGFASQWWPSSGSILGGQCVFGGDCIMAQARMWAEPWGQPGTSARFAFVGYTRDQYGSPVPNCTVWCFRVATDELVSKVVSDANGFYIATTPYTDQHRLMVANNSVSPAIAGASVQLVPG